MNDSPEDDRLVAELQVLIRRASPEFQTRLHRRIERRVLTRDLSVMGWELPKLVLSEALFICAQWLRRDSGGRS